MANKKKEGMAKAAEGSASTFRKIANGGQPEPEQEPEKKPEPVHTQMTPGTKYAKPGYYKFSLSMPSEYEDYLKQAAYNASSPGHIVSITAYINELIRQDMEAKKKKDEKEG